MILGHAHPAVESALAEAIARGLSFGTPGPAEVELAEEIVRRLERLRAELSRLDPRAAAASEDLSPVHRARAEIAARLTVEGAPAPLAVILYRAAAQAAHSISRAEQRHARAISATIDDDGAERWQIDTEAGTDCDAIAPSPEAAAILRESVESVARDQVDRVALTMTARGYTTAEIAAALMVDRSTISRRLYAMRDRYHAQQDNAQD